MPNGVRSHSRVPEGKVKVTVNLEAELVKRAKIAAVERDQTLQAIIEEGLRAVLGRKGATKAKG
jgi:predicted transcriptional regulator